MHFKCFEEGLNLMTRREAREQAFFMIFEKSFNEDVEFNKLIEYAAETGLFIADEYSVELCEKTLENIEKIDSLIVSKLKGWNYSRVSKVARAILRIAVAEMLYIEDVPTGAAINEAVELAKKYAAEKDPAFINGVLGAVAKEL